MLELQMMKDTDPFLDVSRLPLPEAVQIDFTQVKDAFVHRLYRLDRTICKTSARAMQDLVTPMPRPLLHKNIKKGFKIASSTSAPQRNPCQRPCVPCPRGHVHQFFGVVYQTWQLTVGGAGCDTSQCIAHCHLQPQILRSSHPLS